MRVQWLLLIGLINALSCRVEFAQRRNSLISGVALLWFVLNAEIGQLAIHLWVHVVARVRAKS
jgi:hypothetical protein